MKYAVQIEGKERHFECVSSGDGMLEIREGDRVTRIDVHPGPQGVLSLLVDNRSIELATSELDDAVELVRVGGNWIPVEVLDPRVKRMRSLVSGGAGSGAGAVIKAPMPGKVVAVLCEIGASVQKGQPILVVEAMKMENELRAPLDGAIAELHVVVGQSVESGAVLCELSPRS